MEDILAVARRLYDVPEVGSILELRQLIETWGGVELQPTDKYADSLFDEFVDRQAVDAVYMVADRNFIRTHSLDHERPQFIRTSEDEACFDPLEYGEAEVEWTTFQYEVEGAERVFLTIEHDAEDPSKPGPARCYGCAQWFREAIWAATGVMPRDQGDPSDLFSRAIDK